MKRLTGLALVIALAANAAPAFAQQHHSGGGGGSYHAPSNARPAPPPRPALQPRPQPQAQQHPQAPSQHFNLNNDLNNGGGYRRPITTRPPGQSVVVRPPSAHAPQINYSGRTPPGRTIRYPNYNPNQWGWNRGIAWYPSPAYWGGGFWGPFAFGIGIGAFGALAIDGYTYDSYQAAPGTPGSDLLASYQLTQTPCGPPNLVVIWGPDGSVICAYPNNLVAPGQYTIDPGTLTLVSDAQGQ